MKEETWKVRYTLEPGEWKRSDVESVFQGLADSFMVCSIMGGNGEASDYAFFGVNGHTQCRMDDLELFRAWMMLAAYLRDSETLDPMRRELAAALFKAIQSSIPPKEKPASAETED